MEIIKKLSLEEIDVLVRLVHHDASDYGLSEDECEELINETRKRIGYTEEDLKLKAVLIK